MKYDIKEITKWKAPKENGIPILCMPNIPLPLHTLAPRTIMGDYEWSKVRTKEYIKQDYTCQATGVELGKGKVHLHELYSIDWQMQTAKFERYVVLDPRIHTRFVHSGRALTLFERGDKYITQLGLTATLKEVFQKIADYNMKHYDEEPLRICDTILEWAKNPKLENSINDMIKKYKIKFYTFNKRCFNANNWGKWKLIYDGMEYPTKFPTQKDWEEYFKPKNKEEKEK